MEQESYWFLVGFYMEQYVLVRIIILRMFLRYSLKGKTNIEKIIL